VQPGTRLNHYEILAALGEGGMGQVYRAADTRLKRDVAIKVLPPELAADPDRLARLEREAQVLAQLEHPNVAAVYGLEEAEVDGRTERFLVMQLAEGETLEARLSGGALPVDDAVGIAVQVAVGLEAAHARGIVHRDLKPANVILGPTGVVTIVDFGLAKAVDGDGLGTASGTDLTASPTILAATGAGVIMGTAPYMSPEQARGKPVDRRTDLWALGCLLHEMLAGTRAFGGDTATDVIARILQSEPDESALPAGLPAAVRRVLRLCLAKEPSFRLRDAGDAAVLLRQADEPGSDSAASSTGRGTLVPWLVAAVAVIAAIAIPMLRPAPDADGRPERFAATLPMGLGIPTFFYGTSASLAGLTLSPDGTRLVVVGHDGQAGRLYLQRIGDFEATELPRTPAAIAPFFSPGGDQVAFLDNESLQTIVLPGGVPTPLARVAIGAVGGTWSESGEILFASSYASPLWIMDAGGGEPRALTRIDAEAGEASHRWPHALPGGEHVLFVIKTTTMTSLDEARIAIADLETGTHRVLLDGGSRPSYLDSGHIVFARAGRLYAVAFDLATRELAGAPAEVLSGVLTRGMTGNAFYTVNRSGQLAYVAGDGGDQGFQAEFTWVRPGEAPESAGFERGDYTVADIASDGRRVMVQKAAANDKIWVADLVGNGVTQLSSGPGNDFPGVWSPDGRWAVFASDRAGGSYQMYRAAADGSTEPALLIEGMTGFSMPHSLSAEAGLLGFAADPDQGGDLDAFVVPIDAAAQQVGEPVLIAGGEGHQGGAAPAPRGGLVAYTSDESGETAVYVMSTATGGRVRVTRTPASEPKWSPDGRRLYYGADRRIFAVDVVDAEALEFTAPRAIATDRPYVGYAIHPDGRVLGSAVDDYHNARREIRVDLGWGRHVIEVTAAQR
jgi:serine/threonine-protein kinase